MTDENKNRKQTKHTQSCNDNTEINGPSRFYSCRIISIFQLKLILHDIHNMHRGEPYHIIEKLQQVF